MILIHDRVSILTEQAVTLTITAVHRHEDGKDDRAAQLLRRAIRHLEDAERVLAKPAGRKR